MFALRRSYFGALAMARTLGIWPAALLLAWPLLVKLQEPDFFAQQGLGFFVRSVGALWVLMVMLLPLALRFSQGGGADVVRWTSRAAGGSLEDVLSSWLTVVAYGICLLLVGLALSYSVERILGQPSFPHLAQAALRAAALLVIAAALAPALLWAHGSTPTLAVTWLILATALVAAFASPASGLQISAGAVESANLPHIVPTGLATAGGLAISMACREQVRS